MMTSCHGWVSRKTTGCAGEVDQERKDSSLIMVRLMMLAIELDDELRFLGRSLCNAIHDSTPSLGAELL
jgi:hypothetical protein